MNMALCSELSGLDSGDWSHLIMNNNVDIYYYGDYVPTVH